VVRVFLLVVWLAAGASIACAQERSPNSERQAEEAIGSVVFRHQILFNSTPGLLSLITGSLDEFTPNTKVRALLTIDGQLLVVPLRYVPEAKVFRGSFPTPRDIVTYRFQISSDNGKVLLSQNYRSEPRCDLQTAIKDGDYKAFPDQADLLRQAAAYEDRVRATNAVLQKLAGMNLGGDEQ
jgi:hypothetical protein